MTDIGLEGVETQLCDKCMRDPKVCLCHLFPPEAINVTSSIIILQVRHPFLWFTCHRLHLPHLSSLWP